MFNPWCGRGVIRLIVAALQTANVTILVFSPVVRLPTMDVYTYEAFIIVPSSYLMNVSVDYSTEECKCILHQGILKRDSDEGGGCQEKDEEYIAVQIRDPSASQFSKLGDRQYPRMEVRLLTHHVSTTESLMVHIALSNSPFTSLT